MEKEKQIVPKEIIKYLLDTFTDVESIILHGSRAAGFAREHSDWDFIVLTSTKQQQKIHRHEIGNNHFEFKVELLPVLNSEIFDRFDTKLQFSELVYDTDGKGIKLLHDAKEFYGEGIPEKFFDSEYKNYRKQNRLHIVKELQELVDEPAFFLKKLCAIYPQIINEWYWFKQHEFPKNLYISIPEISEKDPWFFEKVKIVYEDSSTRQEKVDSLLEIIDYIYG